MDRTIFDRTKEEEAVNLKVNGIECVGRFFYQITKDHRFTPPIHLHRTSWLEFIVPSDTEKDKVDSFPYLFMEGNKTIQIEDNGTSYDGFLSD